MIIYWDKETNSKNRIGKRVKELRIQKKLSQKGLAEQRSILSENGRRDIKQEGKQIVFGIQDLQSILFISGGKSMSLTGEASQVGRKKIALQ